MVKSRCYFLLVTLSLLLFASCTITKRRYMDGYHVEWRNSNRITSPKAASDDLSMSSKVEEGAIDSSLSEVSTRDTTLVTTPLTAVEIPVKFSQKVKTKTYASLKRRIEEKPVVNAFAHTALRQFESSDEGGITGIKWLDIVIGILILLLLIIYIIYSVPKLKAEISAAWAAVTANIWISLIYFVLILLIILLIWSALDALFNVMLPSGSAGSKIP